MMLWIGSPGRAPIPALEASCGEAAKGTGSAFSTPKLKSGTGLLLQSGEEPGDLGPHLGPSRQPAPSAPDQADQAEALVDPDAVVFAGRRHPVDQQGLD